MNKLEALMYNEGERLIPYVSHNEDELIRHRSSYAFFYSVIAHDLEVLPRPESTDISIVDLGFGTGYGCALLCSLPKTQITGVDITAECETFAKQYYPRKNINYTIEDLRKFIPIMMPYDYVVSRGVLEHVPNGLDLIQKIKFRRRLMIDVPYDEAPGNEHHVLTGIREESFSQMQNCEIFYEDLEGTLYDATSKPQNPNMIMIVFSDPSLPKIGTFIKFPISPIRSTDLEEASLINMSGSHYHFDSANELLNTVKQVIKETEIVADIGCGIVPMNYFRPKLHLMIEPYQEYTDILTYRHADDKSIMILRSGALEALRTFSDNTIDSIFLLDVIEHLEKDEGKLVLIECERVAREQIVIFTPLGFMPQHVEEGQLDAWGLSGGFFQEHRSGWMPEDFDNDWSFYICRKHHVTDCKGSPLVEPHGAFFAIRNFEHKTVQVPEKLSDLRLPLPSELALQNVKSKLNDTQAELAMARKQLHDTQAELAMTRKQLHDTQAELAMTRKQLHDTNFQLYKYQKNLLVRIAKRLKKYSSVAIRVIHSLLSTPLKLIKKNSNIKNIFTKIYQENYWNSKESYSGVGSELCQTGIVRNQLPVLFKKFGIKNMLDIPCGDFNWMQYVEMNDVKYTGADVVGSIVDCNKKKFNNKQRHFIQLDLCSDTLPYSDLVFCRDIFVHLSFADISKAILNIKKSGSKYLLTTTFSGRSVNVDIQTGQWRPLNFLQHPFNYPEPLELINEQCTEGDGSWNDKSLGLWRIEDL